MGRRAARRDVAFPQDGVLRRPGVAELLAKAVEAGAEHVGGLDPASIDRDPVGQVDQIIGICAEHGCGLDIHLHDGAELGAFQMELIIERAERLGLEGKVNFAHGFAIAQLPDARRRDLLQAMGELGMTFTTVAPLRLPQLPLREFDEAGVAFAFGTDGIRDLWAPYGTGDTLGIAWQYARSSSIVRDEDLQWVVDIATRGATASSPRWAKSRMVFQSCGEDAVYGVGHDEAPRRAEFVDGELGLADVIGADEGGVREEGGALHAVEDPEAERGGDPTVGEFGEDGGAAALQHVAVHGVADGVEGPLRECVVDRLVEVGPIGGLVPGQGSYLPPGLGGQDQRDGFGGWVVERGSGHLGRALG